MMAKTGVKDLLCLRIRGLGVRVSPGVPFKLLKMNHLRKSRQTVRLKLLPELVRRKSENAFPDSKKARPDDSERACAAIN